MCWVEIILSATVGDEVPKERLLKYQQVIEIIAQKHPNV